jgi:CheY-like chemotaxis protein
MSNPNATDTLPILLVDDDIDFLTQQRMHLESAGYQVTSAESLAEAEKLLDEIHPAAAVVDLMMEHDDAGFVLCYHIKRRYPDTPVILCSAVQSETALEFDARTDEERSWVKADVMLAKPVRFEQLQAELTRLLDKDAG